VAFKVQHLNDSALPSAKGGKGLLHKLFALNASLNKLWLHKKQVATVVLHIYVLVVELALGKVPAAL
jgi:hypothetical protein